MSDRPSTLGKQLDAFRRAQGLSVKHMAWKLGLELERYRRWQGDVELPDAEGVLKLCKLLDQPPLAVRRLIRASAREILSDALDEVGGHPRAMAARERGPQRGDVKTFLAANLPGALRRALAGWAGVDAEDPGRLAAVLQALALESRARRDGVVEAVAATMELDGEAALGVPPVMDEPGWGQP